MTIEFTVYVTAFDDRRRRYKSFRQSMFSENVGQKGGVYCQRTTTHPPVSFIATRNFLIVCAIL